MRILENINVPTGNILIVEGDKGKLEMLSVGDYGKDVNIKANFLGLNREPSPIRHTELLPLTKKWVITISTQYGCSMGCKFCDVPKVGKGINATLSDLINQVKIGLSLHTKIHHSDRLNIHFARMGEPTWNDNVLAATTSLIGMLNQNFVLHPVVSSMMPKANKNLEKFLIDWCNIKNINLDGEGGLQLSINSTDEAERDFMFNHNSHSLKKISEICNNLPDPIGRKYTLNFAIADYTIDAKILRQYFDPERFICKLTPMHKTSTALKNDIKTKGDYTTYFPYKNYEEDLVKEGFDTLVFIASVEEDLGRITCGNAILSGTKPKKFKGGKLK